MTQKLQELEEDYKTLGEFAKATRQKFEDVQFICQVSKYMKRVGIVVSHHKIVFTMMLLQGLYVTADCITVVYTMGPVLSRPFTQV